MFAITTAQYGILAVTTPYRSLSEQHSPRNNARDPCFNPMTDLRKLL